MTVKAKCAKCGAEVELNDNYKSFVEKYPERVTCFKCKKAGGKSAAKATKKAIEDKLKDGKCATCYKDGKTPAQEDCNKCKEALCSCFDNSVSARKFKEVYHEFKEVFGDELDDVKDYIGGWVSTIIIQGSKSKK